VKPYRLVYWPGIPGRAEYVRLVLEEAQAPYVDTAQLPESEGGGVPAVMAALRGELGGVRPYAPPILQHGATVISQTANLCRYVGRRHDLWPADPALDPVALGLQLTVADLVKEAHDTHHPISGELYHEQQEDAALEAARSFRTKRMPKFLRWFERVLADNGGNWIVGDAVSAVDLALFQTIEGLRYAFPRGARAVERETPGLVDLHDRVAARPNVAAYLASDRRQPFNEDGLFRRYPALDE
jgi:glutathione S-transferase